MWLHSKIDRETAELLIRGKAKEIIATIERSGNSSKEHLRIPTRSHPEVNQRDMFSPAFHNNRSSCKCFDRLKKAIEAIEDNTWGICKSCKEEIDPLRLKLHPETCHCFECKSEKDATPNKKAWPHIAWTTT